MAGCFSLLAGQRPVKTAFSPPLLDTLLRLYGHGENLPAIKQTAPRRLLFRQTMLAPPSTTTC